jgi:hypothetical protein
MKVPERYTCLSRCTARGLTVKKPEIWRVRAAELRRMAERAREVERQRKMLALADQFEEDAAHAAEQAGPKNEDR